MLFSRETGVLLHPTSLPGPWGLGTFGTEAEEFVEWLRDSGASVWQILPLSPPVSGCSPYQCLSSFALNPLFLSPEKLAAAGYLSRSEMNSARKVNLPLVNWRGLENRYSLLEKAADRALKNPPDGYSYFCGLRWVKEWSIFAAFREMNRCKPWHLWKNTGPFTEERRGIHSMIQFLLQEQWFSLKSFSNSRGVRILGDLPFYAAHDSADVYYNRKIFKLRPSGEPAFLAGVPPDYFSRTGQLWGNPVYNWQESGNTEHSWWRRRMSRALQLFDAVRIDHFRGFESYWEIPSKAKTAAEGRWIKGPGRQFFEALEKELGELPVIAEDLGMITQDVLRLREKCGFPGMTVLQFLLENTPMESVSVQPETVVYTGTHDNDTTAGWIASAGAVPASTTVDHIVSLALRSPAELAVIPVQDILRLDSGARMNTPGTQEGNWSFRLTGIPPAADLQRLR